MLPEGRGILLSNSITVGQLTFILRVVVQILSYGGLALITVIVLANTPRLASVATHGVVSRHVGASTTTAFTIKWLLSYIRRNSTDHYPPTNLIIALLLAISYAGFASFSDVGFLGLYSCDVPGESLFDYPASVNTTDAAVRLTANNLINGTDSRSVRAFRCDEAKLLPLEDGSLLDHCISWSNGSYGDPSFFKGLNHTDTDVLMPRQLGVYNSKQAGQLYMNHYSYGLGTSLNPKVQIVNGLAIDAHESGLTVVLGVPSLQPNHAVTLETALAVEVDVGCMTTGIINSHTVNEHGFGIESFLTQRDWRQFSGPEYMLEILTKTVDNVRELLKPYFNESSVDADGTFYRDPNINLTDGTTLIRAANVNTWSFPSELSTDHRGFEVLGNCSAALEQKLGLNNGTDDQNGTMCSLLGLGGSSIADQELSIFFRKMVCATATQINMVRASIGVSSTNEITMNISRIPSILTHTRADYRVSMTTEYGTEYLFFDPYERFTLSINSNGRTQHFIRHHDLIGADSVYDTLGLGSGGRVFAGLGSAMMIWPSISFSSNKQYGGLGLLPDGFNKPSPTPNVVTRWVAQVGASIVVATVGYNGWAAMNAEPLRVFSTGGHAGTCYVTAYAFGFLPLLLSACIIIIWCLVLLIYGSITGTQVVKEVYGGMTPFILAVCPGAPKDTLLIWEQGYQPRLQVVDKGMPVVGNGSETAVEHLKLDREIVMQE